VCDNPVARAARVEQGCVMSYLRKCRILGRATGWWGWQGDCHPALGKLISLNTVPDNVADCGTFLFAPEDEAC